MNRRHFLLSAIGAGDGLRARTTAAKDAPELSPIPIPAGAVASPEASLGDAQDIEQVDVWALISEPWKIEGETVRLGATIRKRYIAPEGECFALGEDGLVFRSVIFATDQTMDFFIGSQTDLSEVEGARTVMVVGEYGGAHAYDGWTSPIVIAHTLGRP
jgi:hypothetical protein